MKKIISLLLTASLTASVFTFSVSADDRMKEILISVKEKIEIPESLTEFRSEVLKNDDDTLYNFLWETKDYGHSINVQTDEYGNLTSYSSYDEAFYESRSTESDKTLEEYFNTADAFLKKNVPQLFMSDVSCLKPDEFKNGIRNNSATFTWTGYHNNVPVEDYSAEVTVQCMNDVLYVSSAYIRWDYTTEFIEDTTPIENYTEKYLEAYPVELIYRDEWIPLAKRTDDSSHKPMLIYRFKNNKAGYILASTGEPVEPETDNGYKYAEESAAADSAMLTANAKGADVLTEQEKAEIDNMNGLLTADDILKKVSDMKVFGEMPPVESFSVNTGKTEKSYRITMRCYKDNKSVSITADAKSGKILGVSNYIYGTNEKEYSESDYGKAKSETEKFLKKYYSEEYKKCVEPEEYKEDGRYSLYLSGTVNNVRYMSGGINVTYDVENKIISSFSLSWPDDTSSFVNPDTAISQDAATKTLLEKAPVTLKYVKTDEMYNLCFISDTSNTCEIDAVTGEAIISGGGRKIRTYSDISGHWAEKAITRIAEHGCGPEGDKFNPDEMITQHDFLRMLFSGINYYNTTDDEEAFYENLIRAKIITEEEKNPSANVLREDAFVFLARFMNLGRIATLNEIFKTDFADNSEISENKIGALAILRGFKIVSGDGVSVRPKDFITRAETASLLWAYMRADKSE